MALADTIRALTSSATSGDGQAQSDALLDHHFSPDELAQAWGLSADTIRRIFEHEPGVLIFQNPVRAAHVRRRRILRIPREVAERVYRRVSNSALDSMGTIGHTRAHEKGPYGCLSRKAATGNAQ